MQNRMSVVAVLLTVACGFMLGLVSVYHVDPIKASWSGWTHRADTVTQVLTCNFDELDSASSGYVELFTGLHGDSGVYHLNVYEYPAGPLVAYRRNVAPGRDHTWLRFDRIHLEPGEVFTKGKLYEFSFTRTGSDSVA